MAEPPAANTARSRVGEICRVPSHRTLHGYAPLRVSTLIDRVLAERAAEDTQQVSPCWPTVDRDEPYADPHAFCRRAHRQLGISQRSATETKKAGSGT